MKKRLLQITIFILTVFCFKINEVEAFSVDNYRNRQLCGRFELSKFASDGTITQFGCYDNYQDAKAAMIADGSEDLAMMTIVNGAVKIVNANRALLDLSVNPETLTYFYEQPETNGRKYTYMDTGSLYGGVDGAFIDGYYSGTYGWNAHVKIGNFDGWIQQSTYEIVPITWVKSKSSYTVTNTYIKHNYVNKIQETYDGSRGSIIGPKPSMLQPGTYYSYDGHYFYTNLSTMLGDYKAGNYNNAVNKDKPYYNYYMYLSNHTKTNYSSTNIDEYIRNYMGYNRDVYGSTAYSGTSRLYGKGTFFYHAQETYGVNAILSLSLSRNETGNGRSNLSINKNNGFGLNAVDSSPTESANWYASFASSILGYANKWITYGYAHPRDWRYFGPQFGDKAIGMNVKYASDTYWSEKMAANYYALDNAYGLQDYDYYQLGVVNTFNVVARRDSYNAAPAVYTYPEAEDALVIVGEKQGDSVNGNTKWYQVVSDLNIDSNYNEITSGNYNWNGTVYVPAAYVKLINEAKDGYKKPTDVTEYQDSKYTYDLLIEDTVLKPKIGYSIKQTPYYYDSTLLSKTSESLLKDRYVMVYTIAYNENKEEVAYLVTSDYWYDQKHWVPADSIKFVSGEYGKSNVDVYNCNCYTWVNYNTQDVESTKISGLYTNTYVPVLEKLTVNGYLWYKVPVNLKGTSNQYGYTLASAPDIKIDLYSYTADNKQPVINAENKVIVQGTKFNELENVKATDDEDGDLTKSIIVLDNPVNIDVVGNYTVKYQVTDSSKETVIKEIIVTVTENKKPEITAKDIEVLEGREYEELKDVTATDNEDGDLTKNITVKENTTKITIPGEYKITYQVTDSYNQTTTKTVKVIVIDDENPVINANDIEITEKEEYNYLKNVTATDKEDGDLTEITIKETTVKNDVVGEYYVIYQVTDSYNQTSTKKVNVFVVKDKSPIIDAEDKIIYLNDEYNAKKNVTATDKEDGDLTESIEVINNNVNPKEVGTYNVTYKVKDSYGNITETTITVYVKEKTLEEKEGLFNLNYLKEENNKLLLQGYQTIYGIDNNLDTNIKYTIIFENIETLNQKTIEAKRITNKEDIPKAVYSPDGKDYTYSWFDATINIDDLPTGNYKMYILAESKDYYSKSLINNKTYKPQVTKIECEEQVATINNNYDTSTSFVELKIRDEFIAEKDSSYIYNQYTKYTMFEFDNENKLYLRGNSYSYGIDLSTKANVERKLVFENKKTFKKYEKDLGSITNGNYQVMLPEADNYDKTRAWFDMKIDLSDIPKGEYVIYITTKSNITDFSEFNEKLGRNLDNVKATIDEKKYSFQINKTRGNRIELIVE